MDMECGKQQDAQEFFLVLQDTLMKKLPTK